jgi:hypothetical protein
VRPFFVVGPQPVIGQQADLLDRFKDVGAEHFLAIAAIEALDVGILIRLARLDVAQLDALSLAPVDERLGGQFGAVVEAY